MLQALSIAIHIPTIVGRHSPVKNQQCPYGENNEYWDRNRLWPRDKKN